MQSAHPPQVADATAPDTRTTKSPPSRTRWKVFLLLLGIVTLNYIDRGSVSVALPLITKDLHLSKEVTGFVLSAFFWTYALMQIPGGRLIDRFGPRRMAAAPPSAGVSRPPPRLPPPASARCSRPGSHSARSRPR